MLWKRKKGEAAVQPLPSIVIRALTYINSKLICLAALLQQRTGRLSARRLKVLLCLFCLLFLSASAYLIISSFSTKETILRVTPIRVVPLAKRPIQQSIISEEEFRRLHRLRLALDSLAKSHTGKVVYDSLLKKYPNLIDTLKLLEKIYVEQH